MWCIGTFFIIFLITFTGIKSADSDIREKLNNLKNHRIRLVKRPPPLNKHRPPNRIRGGDPASKGQFTYAVSLQYRGVDICGGCIIKNQFVVTAAHCVIDKYTGKFLLGQLTILTNVIDLYEDNISKKKINVEKVYVPKEFNSQQIKDYSNESVLADIAVLKLSEAISLKIESFIMKLKLPKKLDESYTGVNAVIVGYGWDRVKTYTERLSKKKYESGQSSGLLRYAIAQVLSNEKCREVMNAIRDSNICAQVRQRREGDGEGTCSGDSGGPLVYHGTLIGVLSTSPFGCEETEGSGVYTRVSSYLNFINAAIDNKMSEDIRIKDYCESSD